MNRKISIIASERLFEEISVRSDHSSISQLRNIASSPRWSSQVYSIHWHQSTGMHSNILSRDSSKYDSEIQVQSKLLRKLPNVRDVHFWILPMDMPFQAFEAFEKDLFELIRSSHMRPRKIHAMQIEAQVAYSERGFLKKLSIGISKEKVSPNEDYSVYDNSLGERLTHPDSFGLSKSLATIEAVSLEAVALFDVAVDIAVLTSLLTKAIEMRQLTLTNVKLFGSSSHHLVDLLLEISKRMGITSGAPLIVTLSNISQNMFDGCFSASHIEITEWVEGTASDMKSPFFVKAEDEFTPHKPPSESSEEDWEWDHDDRGGYNYEGIYDSD